MTSYPDGYGRSASPWPTQRDEGQGEDKMKDAARGRNILLVLCFVVCAILSVCLVAGLIWWCLEGRGPRVDNQPASSNTTPRHGRQQRQDEEDPQPLATDIINDSRSNDISQPLAIAIIDQDNAGNRHSKRVVPEQKQLFDLRFGDRPDEILQVQWQPGNAKARMNGTIQADEVRKIIYVFDSWMFQPALDACASPQIKNRNTAGDTLVVLLKVLPGGGKDDHSNYRRKFMNRIPLPNYLEKNGKSFEHDIIEKIETKMGLHKNQIPSRIERTVVGHSNAGALAFTIFAELPDLFQHAIMVDPAVCDAPVRWGMEQKDPSAAPAATEDEWDTARLYREVQGNVPPAQEADKERKYSKFYDWLKAEYDETKDVNQEKIPGRSAKAVALIEKQWKVLIDSMDAADQRRYVKEMRGTAITMQAKGQATRKRLWREHGLKQLRKKQTEYETKLKARNEKRTRTLTIAYGGGVPRPLKLKKKNPRDRETDREWETNNAFDWIPFESVVVGAEAGDIADKFNMLKIDVARTDGEGHGDQYANRILWGLQFANGATSSGNE